MLYKNNTFKKLLKDNCKPAQFYVDNVKIAGWKEQLFNATSVSQEGTYNDSAFLKINGKSEQVVTMQSANFFDPDKFIMNNSYISVVRLENGVRVTKIGTDALISTPIISLKLNPNSNYIIKCVRTPSLSNGSPFISVSNSTNTFLARTDYGITRTFTTDATGITNFSFKLEWGAAVVNDGVYSDFTNIMLSVADVPYESFVPKRPSTEYQSLINSVSNFDLVSTDDEEQTQTINFLHTLRSLPDGTKDYIEIDNINKTAKLYKNVGSVILRGGVGSWAVWGPNLYPETKSYRGLGFPAGSNLCYCTHLPHNTYIYSETGNIGIYMNFAYSQICLRVPYFTVTELTNWLEAQYNAGTPVTVTFKLATPTITDLDYEEVSTYYPYTQIYTNATIQPTLEGKIRIIER